MNALLLGLFAGGAVYVWRNRKPAVAQSAADEVVAPVETGGVDDAGDYAGGGAAGGSADSAPAASAAAAAAPAAEAAPPSEPGGIVVGPPRPGDVSSGAVISRPLRPAAAVTAKVTAASKGVIARPQQAAILERQPKPVLERPKTVVAPAAVRPAMQPTPRPVVSVARPAAPVLSTPVAAKPARPVHTANVTAGAPVVGLRGLRVHEE